MSDRSVPIPFDPGLHGLGERIDLPYPVTRALAWWLAAELVRRHPKELRVIETHPGGGQSDCVSLYRRDAHMELVAHLNLNGHITHASWFHQTGAQRDSPVSDARFNWLEVLAAQDRRSYVVEALEGVCGLSRPAKTPSTERRSIGPRLLARFASAATFTTRRWEIRNAFLDTSGDISGPQNWVGQMEGPRFERVEGDFLGEPHYRLWAVLDHKDRPAAAVDVDLGLAWRRDQPGVTHDLMDLYAQHGSRIDKVMAKVLPAVE